jgi:hypothetical protein
MDAVSRIDIWASGRGGYLHTRVKLPEHLVRDLPQLLQGAQAVNPAVDADALIRTIWRLGCQALERNNQRHVPVRLADLPHARTDLDSQQSAAAARPADPVSGLRRSRI